MAKHTQKHDPNQVESAVMADIAIGLTETDLLALSQRPPLTLPEDQPMPDISAGDLKILAACKDTILATRKEKVKEALLLRVFHRSRFYRYMQCATFEDFAREHFCMSRTTAYETLYFSDVIVTMAAAGVNGADSIDSTIPSEDDGAAHAVPPEAIPATTHPVVDKGTERFEEIYVKTVKRSSSSLASRRPQGRTPRTCENGYGRAAA